MFGEIAYSSVAGIIGIAYGFVQLSDCANYANIHSKEITGALVSNISVGSDNVKEGRVDIINCYNFSNNPLIGQTAAVQMNYELIVNIKKVESDYTGNKGPAIVCYAKQSNSGILNLSVENCKVNLLSKEGFIDSVIVRQMTGHIYLKNILISGRNIGENFKQFLINSQNEDFCHITTIIAISEHNCFYDGNDFSDYYIDFKTGKIGLKVMRGKGFYQGKVTEEILKNKGYIKKEV